MSVPRSQAIDEFWTRFRAHALRTGFLAPVRYGHAEYFGDGEAMASELAELVLRGDKTATAGLLWEYEAEGAEPPKPGGYSVLTDFGGRPLAVLRTLRVEVRPFDEVDAAFAFAEGEGDRTLEYWRSGHWAFFTRVCAHIGREPDPKMPIVCERFEVSFRERPASSDN